MNTSEVIESLGTIGLSEREAKIYFSLLQVYEATAPEIHRLSGVPRTKIYEAIEHLVSMGYCIERMEGRSKHYQAAPLESVKYSVMQAWEDDIKKKIKSADSIFNVLEKFISENNHEAKTTDFVHVIRSKKSVSDRYISLLNGVKEEIVCFSRPPYASVDERSAMEQDKAEYDCIQRGVNYKVICMVDDQWWKSNVRDSSIELSRQGIDIRYINNLPIKMNVFDRHKTLIALASVPGATGSDFTMLEIVDPGFAKSCMILFETFWKMAIPTENMSKIDSIDKMFNL